MLAECDKLQKLNIVGLPTTSLIFQRLKYFKNLIQFMICIFIKLNINIFLSWMKERWMIWQILLFSRWYRGNLHSDLIFQRLTVSYIISFRYKFLFLPLQFISQFFGLKLKFFWTHFNPFFRTKEKDLRILETAMSDFLCHGVLRILHYLNIVFFPYILFNSYI